LVFTALLLAVGWAGCEGSETLTIVNNRDVPITLFDDEEPSVRVGPRSTKEIAIYAFDGVANWSLRTAAGEIISEVTITFKEMEERGGVKLVAE
jgi:hypothetical protein